MSHFQEHTRELARRLDATPVWDVSLQMVPFDPRGAFQLCLRGRAGAWYAGKQYTQIFTNEGALQAYLACELRSCEVHHPAGTGI